MPNAEQFLYQTEKSIHRRFPIKTMSLKISQYSQENTYVKFLKTPIFKNIYVRLFLNWLYEVIIWKFVSGPHLKPSWLGNITKIPVNLSFKQNLVHMPSIYLIPTLSCEPRFRMFIINSYCTKNKRL